MSCNTIYYSEGAKMLRPVTSRDEYLKLRNSGSQLSIVGAVRAGDAKLKHRLLQMNYSLCPASEGTAAIPLKGCTTASTSVGMDVDILRIENEDESEYQARLAAIPEKVLSKKAELGLLMLERSATKGYHLAFRRHPELSQEENLRWASDLLGVEFDKGAKDITRVFFTTTASPEDLLFLDDELFGQEVAPTDCREQKTAPPSHDKEPEAPSAGNRPSDYLGIPYERIIRKWWELYNDGQEPCSGNRNTLTFELAVNLRHICGFDKALLDQVIPDYWAADGQQGMGEKMRCIESALSEKRTQMPKRLKDVLQEIKRDLLNEAEDLNPLSDDPSAPQSPDPSAKGKESIVAALDRASAQDDLYHYDRLPRMPQGVRDSIDAAGHTLAMPTLIAIAPAIGALATGVKLDVHGKARGLNLCSFVVGEFASGKGQMDDILAAWMHELQTQADVFTQQEEEWAAKTKRMKSGTAPEQPKLPVRMLTLNNTVANIAERLANTEGKHSFSFTPEADNVALKWKQSVSDFSVMLRQAYDEARYDREAKSADAVRVHIQKLLWNVTMCGTQDALYRVITNYTDGLLSRIAIARTPDNTYAPLDSSPARMTDRQEESIRQIAHLLPMMEGTIVLPKLEERGRAWLETIRMEAMKNDDRVLARQRMRGCVNAQRITVALWLPKVAEMLIRKHGMNGAEQKLKQQPQLWAEMLRKQQSKEMLQLFDIVADYLLDNDLYYFRERIEAAYESKNYQGNAQAIRNRRGRNDSIFERLATKFTFEQALQQTIAVKGNSATRNSVHQMLKNWKNQGLIAPTENGQWIKEPLH